MHYIFGYGSLICQDSRSRTGISGQAHPIEVKGIARKWSMHSPEWPATAVSAHDENNALSNGVYFKVDETNLERFDEREKGYRRVAISWDQVKRLNDQSLPTQGTLWAYVGNERGQPSLEKPIMQSYVDVILNGCLDYGQDFAVRFAETTHFWSHLVDDRHQPQYPRPLRSQERIPHIDQIIQSHLPELWQKRRTHRHT